MYNFLAKNGQAIAFAVGAVLTAIFLISAFSGLENFNMLSKEAQWETNIFNIGFYAAIALTILCLVAAVIFGLVQMLGDLKGALKGLIAIVALLAIFFIIYSAVDPSAAPADVKEIEERFDVTASQSKFISGSIITTVALTGLALVTFVVFEVINFFR